MREHKRKKEDDQRVKTKSQIISWKKSEEKGRMYQIKWIKEKKGEKMKERKERERERDRERERESRVVGGWGKRRDKTFKSMGK